jgi:hypothetical protein
MQGDKRTYGLQPTKLIFHKELILMFVQYEGSVPKRCLNCGGLMIENTKHECITSGSYSYKSKEELKMKHVKLNNDLLTGKYTDVWYDGELKFNAPHHFNVIPAGLDYNDTTIDIPVLTSVHFQEGQIKEAGVNGVHNEDLIAMVISRLEHFQNSEFRCRENALAITALEEALLWLRKRTMGRENRGVEGTHQK